MGKEKTSGGPIKRNKYKPATGILFFSYNNIIEVPITAFFFPKEQ